MKSNIERFAIAAILTLSASLAFSAPAYFSIGDLVTWVSVGGHVASGTGSLPAVASEGARYVDKSAIASPVEYLYASGSWRKLSGGSSGTTDHSALLSLTFAASGHTGFASAAAIPNNASFTFSGLSGAKPTAASYSHSGLLGLDFASSGHTGFAGSGDLPNNASFTAAGLSDFPSLSGKSGKYLQASSSSIVWASAPVTSVFGRSGDVKAQASDYASFFSAASDLATLAALVGSPSTRAFNTEAPYGYPTCYDPGTVAGVRAEPAAATSSAHTYPITIQPKHGYGPIGDVWLVVHGTAGNNKFVDLGKTAAPNSFATSSIVLSSLDEAPVTEPFASSLTVEVGGDHPGVEYVTSTGSPPVSAGKLYISATSNTPWGIVMVTDPTYTEEYDGNATSITGNGEVTMYGSGWSVTVNITGWDGYSGLTKGCFAPTAGSSGFEAQSYTWGAELGSQTRYLQKTPLEWVAAYPAGNDFTGGEGAIGTAGSIGSNTLHGFFGPEFSSREFYGQQTSVYAQLDALKDRLEEAKYQDVSVYMRAIPSANEVVYLEAVTRPFRIPGNIGSCSSGICLSPPSGPESLRIMRGSGQVATATIAANGSFTWSSIETQFLFGDSLSIVAPASATFSQTAISIKTKL